MKQKAGLTRIEAMVVIACIVFLFINIGALTAGGRAGAKKEVCLANLKTLMAGWQIYAEANGGKLVNGCPLGSPPGLDDTPPPEFGCSGIYDGKAVPPTINSSDSNPFLAFHCKEIPWIGAACLTGQDGFIPAPECQQRCAIQTGALWKYIQSMEIYRCSDSNKNNFVTYSIVDSMNGKYTFNGSCAMSSSPKELCPKNLSQIIKPEKRIVFIEEQPISPDSYGVFYGCEKWFDLPCVRHIDGSNVSFADGHSEFWKWKSKETIDIGKGGVYMTQPLSVSAKQDLYRVQIGCWGKLGYTPSVPIE